jgi:peptidyl-prolyl cis-trans isomerase SurA
VTGPTHVKLWSFLLLVGLAVPAFAQKKDQNDDRLPETKVDRAADGKAMDLDRVAAVVDNTIILESEVLQRATPMLADAEQREQNLDPNAKLQLWRTTFRKALDQMVEEQLIIDAANEAKLEVNEDEVQKALDEVKRQNKLTDAMLEGALKAQGASVAEYKRDVRRQILRLRAINVLVRPRVQVSDDEVKAKYEKLSGQSSVITEVHIRHILLPLPEKPSPADLDLVRRKAGDLVSRVRAGEDFAAIAQQVSTDNATKAQGGDLGWYKRGELPTEWEEILFTMEPGEVRGPVQGPRGLHVFLLVENKKESVRPFAEVKDQLKEQLFQEEMEKQTKVWLQELRKKAHVEIKM